MTPVNAETSALNFIQTAYQTIDQLNLSMGSLALIAVIVTIAFLFATRELAAWFFKIDDLKKDIRSLEVGISRLEAEIKTLQEKNSGAVAAPLSELSTPKLRSVEQFPINH